MTNSNSFERIELQILILWTYWKELQFSSIYIRDIIFGIKAALKSKFPPRLNTPPAAFVIRCSAILLHSTWQILTHNVSKDGREDYLPQGEWESKEGWESCGRDEEWKSPFLSYLHKHGQMVKVRQRGIVVKNKGIRLTRKSGVWKNWLELVSAKRQSWWCLEKMWCVGGDQYNNQQMPNKTQIFHKVLDPPRDCINISGSLSVILYVNNINCVMSVVDKHSSDDFEVLEFE